MRLGLKLKHKTHRVLEFNQSQWLKPLIEFNLQKRVETQKNNDKDAKALYKLVNNEKAIQNVPQNQVSCCIKYLKLVQL